ncbi:hypothetical protein PHYBLDRAFT_175561 [Phycomyces blakesleeanus NRRL 1555(-)]|uniref:Uncharacterized protein n=1 Tax=Phycomyces blakesleeanus (strain ATCC 8743b / DSM 1359 / FGSC 10004 / NBRC 33097 / NRRL 1555) TaxID=763407 RepID=A0A167JIB8_PHYB8|nr:hypothetical protein PHYBLDRAFT_175561 [Phycomyces blakesleeanus NRRL 1555(-)]OAD66036.1 hypothetical protein PHYBLDRAFT_175561 [Phycomyces blakesleeanus NRRL 1555(-)]|eukprot:XP_018284076.1 hypothetical protein PHYBLDRAFT_175561 [Phycomyces blakesleeanus NRRL 1555(-)]
MSKFVLLLSIDKARFSVVIVNNRHMNNIVLVLIYKVILSKLSQKFKSSRSLFKQSFQVCVSTKSSRAQTASIVWVSEYLLCSYYCVTRKIVLQAVAIMALLRVN